MVQTTQIGRRLTQKRQVRRFWQQAVQQGIRAVPALQDAANLPAFHAAGAKRPFYETATPEEWLAAFTEWTESHHGLPCVPASAFSREADYEDRL